MNKIIGKRCWVIPDGHLPCIEDDTDFQTYVSHECLCILNAGTEPATIEIIVYFEDRDPCVIGDIKVARQRSKHLRIDDLQIEDKPAIFTSCSI